MEILESRRLLTTLYVDGGAPGPTHDGQSWSNAFLTIQDALAAAVSSDQIFVAGGTYAPPSTLQLPSSIALRGGYAGASNPPARDITLYPSIISGSDSHQVLAATDTASGTTLDGLTIQDGDAAQGGGIDILRGSLSIQGCTFKSDSATDGGALYADNTSLTLTDTTFTHNWNEQSDLTGGYTVTHGSAVYSSHSVLQVDSCTFDTNLGSMGSAIYNNASTASIINSTFTNNEAYNTSSTSFVFIFGGAGGAIYNSASTVAISASTFNENTCPNNQPGSSSGFGGAIYNEYNSPLTVINSTFADNSADGGGALYGDTITLQDCTIDSNGANSGRAISSISHPDSITITNSILWGPSTGQVADGGSGTMNISYSDIHGGYPGAGNIDQIPEFVADVNAGPDKQWETSDDSFGDLDLQSGSPCIDAGNSAALPPTLTTDKDGNARAIDDPFAPDTGQGPAPVVDMGALEFVAPSPGLIFGQQPVNTAPGAFIMPAVTVDLVDSSGHIGTSETSAVTLSIAAGPPGGRLLGTVTVNAINGIATFDKLSIQVSGSYTLQAADAGDSATPVVSVSFNILGSQPTFATQPTSTIAGHGPLVVVKLRDVSGQLATNDDSPVTLAIASGPDGATLGGTTTVSAINGVATFNDLHLLKAGIYTLEATDASMIDGTVAFTVAAERSTSRLVLLQQPADGAIVGKILSPGFQFAVEDEFGNVVKTDRSTVKLTVTSGPGGLRGRTSRTVAAGIANFRNLAFNGAGTYTLQAADGSLGDTTPVSMNDTIIRGPTTLPTPAVARAFIFGRTITLRQVLKSNNSIPFTGSVTLTDQKTDILATATLSAAGAYRLVVTDVAPGTYTCTVNYPGDANHAGTTSSNFTLQINKSPTVTTLKASSGLLYSGQPLTLSAAVKSPYPEDTPRTGTIMFRDGSTVLGAVALDRNSSAILTIPATTVGQHLFTAVYSGDSNFEVSTSHAEARTVGNATAIAVVTAPFISVTVGQNEIITQMGR